MIKLNCLVGQDDKIASSQTGEEDCFICKHDQDLYIKAKEKNKLIQCTCCKTYQHALCYKVSTQMDKISSTFTCIQCRIIQNQPNLSDLQLIIGPLLIDGSKEKQLQDRIPFNFSKEQAQSIEKNSFIQVIVFCVKVDMYTSQDKFQYYSWPSDNIVVKVNDQIQCYQVDKVCLIEKEALKLHSVNSFSYDLGDSKAFDFKHVVVGVCVVQMSNMSKVLEKIILSQTQTSEDNKQIYKQWSKDMEMEISFSMKDQITQTLIKWPARGKQCSHFTCIDLYTYLEFNLGTTELKNVRWSCPTCQQRLYVKDIIFDKYLYNFAKKNIVEKIEQEFICLVDEVTSDFNGQLRISDISVEKLETAKLKKFLKEQNQKIEKEIAEQKEIIEEEINQEIKIKTSTIFNLGEDVSATKIEQANEFKKKYETINISVEEIFENEKAFFETLLPLEFVVLILDKYRELKVTSLTGKGEISGCESFQKVIHLIDSNRTSNDKVFTFIRLFSKQLYGDNESQQRATIALILILLSTKERYQYFSVEQISYDFIILSFQYSLFEDFKNPGGIDVPLLIGELFFYFTKISDLSFEGGCSFLTSFIYLAGTGPSSNHLILSQQESSLLFLSRIITQYLLLPHSPKIPLLPFFKKLLGSQIQALFTDSTNSSRLVNVFKLICKILFAYDETFKDNSFKQTKEFLSLLVDKNTAIISYLKGISQKIFL